MTEFKYAVVCVDDDPYILQMLGFQLSKIMDQKCTLIEYFTEPEDAIENIDMLITEKIDIIFIIVDYQMPKMIDRFGIINLIERNLFKKETKVSGS